MKLVLLKLTEEQIANLPFPETARKLGGILVPEEEALPNHLNLEEFRKQWNKMVGGGGPKIEVILADIEHYKSKETGDI